jgi:predicted alpha/beta hydrolase family esterase
MIDVSMIDVLFIQGAGSGTHADWDSRLVESLRRELGPRYRIRYPRMPEEADPTMAAWRPVIEEELASLGPGAIVVGHSAGGTMLIHVLASVAPPAALGAIVLLAAPFIGDGGWPSEELGSSEELGARLPATVPVLLYHGEDDTTVPVAHVERYGEVIPRAVVRRLAGRDHQVNDDLSEVASDLRALAPDAVTHPNDVSTR